MKKQNNVIEKTKICKKCDVRQNICNFYKSKLVKGGFENICKVCKSNIYKTIYVENKQYINERNMNYYNNNKEEHNTRTKNHYYNNKEYYVNYNKVNRVIINKKKNNKYHNDINFKLRTNISNRILSAILDSSHVKSSSTISLLGCSLEKCKYSIEIQFLPEMSWENHGEIWEIDHILPCASFDLTLEDEQKKCFHYSNLQPLFKTTKIAESFGYTDQIGNRNKKDKIWEK